MTKSKSRKFIAMLFSVLMVLAITGNSLAVANDVYYEDETNSGIPFELSELIRPPLTVDEIIESATFNGVYVDETNSRGDNLPTAITSLPYTGSGTALVESVYSNYKFLPNSNGTVNMTFTGTVSSGTATITIYLCNASTGAVVKTWSVGTGSGWINVSPASNPFTGLSTSTYYCYKIVKTPTTNTLSYTLKVS